MTEVPTGIEQQTLIERAKILREGARKFTREIVTKTFPGNPVKPEDHLSIFTGIDTAAGGKLGILITKPSTGEAKGGTEGEDQKVDVLIGGIQNDFTPISTRAAMRYLWDAVSKSPKDRMVRNLYSTMHTDARIAQQFSLDELNATEPPQSEKVEMPAITPVQLDKGERMLRVVHEENTGIHPISIDRWQD